MADTVFYDYFQATPKGVEARVEINSSWVSGFGGDRVEALDSLHHGLMNLGHRVFQMAADVSKLMREQKACDENHGASIRAQPDGEPAESKPTQGDGAAV